MSTLTFVLLMLAYIVFSDRDSPSASSCQCEPREYTDQELGEGLHLRD